jgi:MFS family permease
LTRGGDARHILVVQALRAFVYGLGSVLIGVTLADLGLSGLQVGLVLSALIAGTAIVSVILARSGDQIGRRRWYVGLLALMALSGTVFALTDSVWLLVLVALTGTVSTEVVESGPFTSLEQAMLPNAPRATIPRACLAPTTRSRRSLARSARWLRSPPGGSMSSRNGSSLHTPQPLARRSWSPQG